MPVVRGRLSFEGNFTQIPNAYIRDSRLSLRARGLFTLLLSNVEGWQVTVSQLQKDNPEGRDAIRSAILELEELGYLRREQKRIKGRFDESVWITADPYGPPVTGLPLSENPISANPTHKNTNNKNTNTKKEKRTNGAHLLPSDFEPEQKSIDSMAELYPWLNLVIETEKFRDYWASATRNALKKNWQAAWRSWMHRAAEYSKPTEMPQKKHQF